MITTFFLHIHDLSHLNHANIAFIPKLNNPTTPNHFRPISLCNVAYKIISKILANRLKPLLLKIISPIQSAFVSTRQITDNIITAHEIIHTIRSIKSKHSLMAIKIDMAKAFDTLSWACLDSMLHLLGFHPAWCLMIQRCISSASFSILLNGSPEGLFHSTRGLRQGDPISPMLFIIYMEILTRSHNLKEAESKIKGAKIGRLCPPVTHLLFADDIFIFCHATLSNTHEIFDTLKTFSSITGQTINHAKSGILFNKKFDPRLQKYICSTFKVKQIQKSESYLGVPLFLGENKRILFEHLLARVNSRITGWKRKLLNQTGRTTLIKSITSAIPMYQMSCFLLPKHIYKSINAIQRDFWWGLKDNEKKIYTSVIGNPCVYPQNTGVWASEIWNKLIKQLSLASVGESSPKLPILLP